ncbi:E3 ubiquitin-protein ligase NEURL1B [Senna tora]|uniref:E3 ubiquitin-protein ligase NEURL1B n=1 Tax=Senna tora TaxID=362788 RepID=A0A834W683_9FABA|nr:E3 ubiquitin-protein ligase NEURL1B [Senna tora]
MAIVSLHNVSVLDSSFFRESHSQSSRRRPGDGGRGGTRSSSLLQMWQDIEDEHVELKSSSGENSPDLGEVERERVRQIFREWMNSGARDHASNISPRSNGSRAEWLGETEQERVRVIREWVQMSSQQSGLLSGDNREEQSAEIGTQIERVRDGFVVNKNEGQIDHSRRGIRKLCGRQVLLDMLKKAERERQREVQELWDNHAVSHFPHRNRIQALLRGRFLRNDRAYENNRSTSVAESELGLLRQKQTVSGLREGFFSGKDISGCSLVTSNLTDTSSNSDIDADTNQQTEPSSSQEPNYRGTNRIEISGGQNCLLEPAVEKLDWQDSSAHIEEQRLHLLEFESKNLKSLPSAEIDRRDGTGQSVDVMSTEVTTNGLTQPGLQIEDTEHSNLQEFNEEYNDEQSELGVTINDGNGLSNNALPEQPVGFANDGSDWLPTNVERRNSSWERMDVNHTTMTSNEWPQIILENEDRENFHVVEVPEMGQEDDGLQAAVENWLRGPSDEEGAPVSRTHQICFPYDDNMHSEELTELLSRRRVSNLLSSSFRQNLDRLIQSYVERQEHAQIEWELQEFGHSDSVEDDLEQQSWDQISGGEEGAAETAVQMPSSPTPSQPLWDQQLHHDNWPQSEGWEIINGLRIDIAVLQQRMNSMQRMLEACMDLQLELQRSIKQEVSAALNSSSDSSSGLQDHDSPDDKSKWDYVRKGLCCICCESNIDSLLYRCGHMCTCLKCANELLQSKRKCPMCQAPVMEAIHAYSIL